MISEIMKFYVIKRKISKTKERNTLDLILTSLRGQFVDIHSPDKLSDHAIVSGILKIATPL